VIKNIAQSDDKQAQNRTIDGNSDIGQLVFKVKRVNNVEIQDDKYDRRADNNAKLGDNLQAETGLQAPNSNSGNLWLILVISMTELTPEFNNVFRRKSKRPA
jgi:hypothetical protein